MKVVVFGLAMSSSWGNGHATIWRGLARGLSGLGHELVFFERDAPYYSSHRDAASPEGASLVIYPGWDDVRALAQGELDSADAAVVTSYCPDGPRASELVLSSRAAVKCFYDLDTPVTLRSLAQGTRAPYLPHGGLSDFDLVLSYTGGRAVDGLRQYLGARRVQTLYGCVDPAAHRPSRPSPEYEADLSYLGTYAQDRQGALERLLMGPAAAMPELRFIVGGSMYPPDLRWAENTRFAGHVPCALHPSFYCSSAFTLNVTRGAMARMGWCPSPRLFEAAACAVPVITDWWEGIDAFFEPGSEIVIARTGEDVAAALDMGEGARTRMGRRARERALDEHSAEARAGELVSALGKARR